MGGFKIWGKHYRKFRVEGMKKRHREYASSPVDQDVVIALAGLSSNDQVMTVMFGLLVLGAMEVRLSFKVVPVEEDNMLVLIVGDMYGNSLKRLEAVGVDEFYNCCGLVAAFLSAERARLEGKQPEWDEDLDIHQDKFPF